MLPSDQYVICVGCGARLVRGCFLRMPQLAQGESRVQYSTAQHSTAQHSTARPAVLCVCSRQHRAALCRTMQHHRAAPCSRAPCGQSRMCRAASTIRLCILRELVGEPGLRHLPRVLWCLSTIPRCRRSRRRGPIV